MFNFFSLSSIMKLISSQSMISILMSMEMMMLSIFLIISFCHHIWFSNSSMVIVMLSFMVCESVMGLGCYIYLSRLSGEDEMKSTSLKRLN